MLSELRWISCYYDNTQEQKACAGFKIERIYVWFFGANAVFVDLTKVSDRRGKCCIEASI